MAKQKDTFKDIEHKAPTELTRMLHESKDRLWTLGGDLAAGKVKNVREMHVVKKTIARILTVMNREKVKK
ncbi:MAG: 50S ribosomal protein L29 [Patescibacteria group bacterium]